MNQVNEDDKYKDPNRYIQPGQPPQSETFLFDEYSDDPEQIAADEEYNANMERMLNEEKAQINDGQQIIENDSDLLSQNSNKNVLAHKKLDTSQRRLDELLCDMAYYRAIIDQQIVHGYHDAERATHNDGIHHKEFLETRQHLEDAVNEYIRAWSIIEERNEKKR